MNEGLLQSQVDLIREVFLYANRFSGKRFVIQIASEIVEDVRFHGLIRDLGILAKSGIHLVLVPGAGRRIDEVLSSYGVETKRVKGVRVSSPEAMPLIKMAAFDVANMVMTQLSSQQVDAVIGNWVKARSIGVRDGVDYQDAGTISKVNLGLLEKVMAEGIVPILPCIGWSGNGTPYNISSIELACHLAEQLGAAKLFFISDEVDIDPKRYAVPESEGVVVREGMVQRLTTAAAVKMLELNTQYADEEGMELLRLAARATKAGVERIHILDGWIDGVILKEIFSTLGQGTMIHSDPFDSIRAMRSTDIAEVLHIMEPSIQKGILVRRDEEDLKRLYKDFAVYESDGTIRGCAALHPFDGVQSEIAGLAVDPNFGHIGIGQKLVQFLIDRGRSQGLKQIFLLTTQTGDFFESLGFEKGAIEDLPEEKQANYNTKRKSRVYIYPLA